MGLDQAELGSGLGERDELEHVSCRLADAGDAR